MVNRGVGGHGSPHVVFVECLQHFKQATLGFVEHGDRSFAADLDREQKIAIETTLRNESRAARRALPRIADRVKRGCGGLGTNDAVADGQQSGVFGRVMASPSLPQKTCTIARSLTSLAFAQRYCWCARSTRPEGAQGRGRLTWL